jgi:acetyl esterase/lipase
MKSLTGLFILILLTSFDGYAKNSDMADSLKQQYLSELSATGKIFSAWFYPSRDKLYSLPEKIFVGKIDSARNAFAAVLNKYSKIDREADPVYIHGQQKEIHYFFDRIIFDYPYFHEMATGKVTKRSPAVQKRMDKNLADFNDASLLSNIDFRNYIDAFLHEKTNIELKKPVYKTMDNQRVNSVINVISTWFTNNACNNFWKYHYLFLHLDDWGVKNMDKLVASFNATCKDTSYTNKINAMYEAGMKQRAGHIIKTYKTAGGFDLDMHIFLPIPDAKKRPVMVYFTGGSWTKGSPEWSFSGCEYYAKKGWVGISVEYRLADRHSTTPFEAVMDARSAIRWLRQHADEYNIDTNRIVASGNSAGGHLVLATALATKWNEKSDDLKYSPTPNLLLINSGVYDFVGDGTTNWVSRPLKDKNTVREISPAHLVRKGLPPMIFLHGTNDQSVPYASALLFEGRMKEAGNDYEFHTLEGAPHEIWFDRRFTGRVEELKNKFLKKYGYE